MTVEDCEAALRETASELAPLLEPFGFVFHLDQAGQGHQVFASGFFVRGEVKIGIIYRGDRKFGTVSYENAATSVSHDELMRTYGLRSEALAADLSRLAPVLGDPEVLSSLITKARRQSGQAKEQELAQKAAKREAWLRKRR